MDKFRKLGIIEPILKSIAEQRFEEPSEIQQKAIPYVVQGRDVIAGSATGSGKTLAFAAAIIKNCEHGKGLQALVLTPTRELAEQVSMMLKMFSKHKPLEMVGVYGGVSINPQFEKLPKADVVVGTPGRILDHIGRRTIDLSRVSILVLDEADRMLDMGFIDDVERIIKACPKKRQTMLFSATMPHDIEKLADRYMNHPVRASAIRYVDPRKLSQIYYDVPDNLKFSLLVHLLRHEHVGLVMVFCNSQRNTDFIANSLMKQGIDATALHGGLPQAKRLKVLDRFHSKDVCVLICTDVASRGLDIKGVSHIYNYDIPNDPKQYIHRIGRTARAGKAGRAVNILGPRDHENFAAVLRDYDVNIVKQRKPHVERIMIRRDDGRSRGRGALLRQGQRRGRPRRREGQGVPHRPRSHDERDSIQREGHSGR